MGHAQLNNVCSVCDSHNHLQQDCPRLVAPLGHPKHKTKRASDSEPPSKAHHSSSPADICPKFKAKGSCSFGSSCKYWHVCGRCAGGHPARSWFAHELVCLPPPRKIFLKTLVSSSKYNRSRHPESGNSIPVMKSYYSRGRHSKHCKYLSPLLHQPQMHDLYLQKYKADVDKPTVLYSYYKLKISTSAIVTQEWFL